MKVGFIGLGNAGGKLAGSLLRNGYDLTVRDLDKELVANFVSSGAKSANSPKKWQSNAMSLLLVCLPLKCVQR